MKLTKMTNVPKFEARMKSDLETNNKCCNATSFEE